MSTTSGSDLSNKKIVDSLSIHGRHGTLSSDAPQCSTKHSGSRKISVVKQVSP